VTVQAQVLEMLLQVKDELNAAIILITHDLGVVAGTADRVAVMYAGRFVETGSVDEIFEEPKMPYTQGLLGAIPSIEGEDGALVPIPGTPPSLVNAPSGCPFTPRCAHRADRCETSEPELLQVGGAGHLSACHRSNELSEL